MAHVALIYRRVDGIWLSYVSLHGGRYEYRTEKKYLRTSKKWCEKHIGVDKLAWQPTGNGLEGVSAVHNPKRKKRL